MKYEKGDWIVMLAVGAIFLGYAFIAETLVMMISPPPPAITECVCK